MVTSPSVPVKYTGTGRSGPGDTGKGNGDQQANAPKKRPGASVIACDGNRSAIMSPEPLMLASFLFKMNETAPANGALPTVQPLRRPTASDSG